MKERGTIREGWRGSLPEVKEQNSERKQIPKKNEKARGRAK